MSYLKRHPVGGGAVVLLLAALGLALGWSAWQPDAATQAGAQSARHSAQAAQEQSLREEIAGLELVLASSRGNPEEKTQARLRLAECHLDVTPGEEFLTIQYAQEVLDSGAAADDKVRAKLLLAESYRSWRYQALKLYTQVIDDHPGTLWEAWAKVGMARTLAQDGENSEPPLQCEHAVQLLDEAMAQWPGTDCAAEAQRLLPPIRAYFDFPRAVQDLEALAPDLELWQAADYISQMLCKAARGGATADQLAASLREAAGSASEPVASVALHWAEVVAMPLLGAKDAVTMEELATAAQICWVRRQKDSLEDCRHWRDVLAQLNAKLPARAACELWFELGVDAYRVEDLETERVCLDQLLAVYYSDHVVELDAELAANVAHLARRLGEAATAQAVLTDAADRWPYHHQADRVVAELARGYNETCDQDRARLLYHKLLTEFPVSKHRQARQQMIEREYPLHPGDGGTQSPEAAPRGAVP